MRMGVDSSGGFAEQLSKNEGQSDSVERFCIRNEY